jgi:predicted DNA-binding transcriptional regulator AlpA
MDIQDDPGQFFRLGEMMKRNGYNSRSQFYEDIKQKNFPAPDGYLGPRSPFWTERTERSWRQRKLAEHKQPPIQTPRRRKTAEAV